MNWQTRIYLVVTVIALIVLAYILPAIHTELVWFIRLVLGAVVVTLIGLMVMGGLMCKEWYLEKRAKRQLEQYATKSGKYRDYQDGFGMLHLLNLDTDIVENLSANPTSHHNGTWQEPPKTAMMAWFALVSRDKQINQQVVQLPAQAESQLDLLTIFTQPTQSYAIIAGQQVGKTFQARRIAQHWLSTGCKPIVIGPKWDRDEWDGCTLFGGEYNLQQVNRGMQVVKRLAEDRHSDKNLSHKQHAIQPVFFDDWTAIRAKLEKEAESLIVDATTLYASVNIVLYFIIHLDTANAWGVGRVGAALHQNFYKLFIEPGMDSAGLIDRSRNVGYVLYPGQSKKDRKRVGLFGGTGSQLLLPDLVIQPNDEAQRIIQMVGSGMSYKDISESVWGTGKFGKFYNEKIDRILSKYSPRIS